MSSKDNGLPKSGRISDHNNNLLDCVRQQLMSAFSSYTQLIFLFDSVIGCDWMKWKTHKTLTHVFDTLDVIKLQC